MSNRDYTLIIDRSGSMGLRDQPGGRSRWAVARESAEALAAHCDDLDPDGITLYVFAGKFRRYDNVHAPRVQQVFLENEPCGGTDLAGVLAHAFDSYFTRKRAGKVKDGETIVVVTDGEPDDKTAVLRTIVDAARKVEREEELGVSLVQVGTDPQATRFLKVLDDDLVGAGARFDIVDTVTLDEMEDIGLTEVLLRAIYD
jgi:von Willebrand factor type A domain